MAGLVESFIFKMVVDNAQFNAGLAQSTAAVNKAGKAVAETEGLLQRTSSAFLGVAVVRSSLNVLGEAVKASANLANAQATVQQVFGDSTDTIRKYAEESVSNFGLSERAALEAATNIAALGKAAGLQGDDLAEFSVQMLKTATDLAAFYNTTVDQAIGAIQSGLSGSSIEPLRRYGVIINDTILKNELFALTGEKVVTTLTQQQRTIAFLSVLQRQSADATGQWQREYDSFNSSSQRFTASMENLKATLGDSIVGPAAALSGAFAGVATATGAVVASTGPLVPSLAMTAVTMQVLGPAVRAVQTRMGGLWNTLRLGPAAITPSVLGFGALAAGITVANAVMADMQRSEGFVSEGLQRIAEGGTSVAQALDEMTKPRDDWDWQAYMPWAQDDWEKVDPQEVIDQFEELAKTSPEMAARVYDAMTATKAGNQALETYGISADRLKTILQSAIQAQIEAEGAQRDWTQVLAETTDTIVRNEKAWDDYKKGLDELDKAADGARRSIEKLMDEAGNQFTADFDPQIARQQLVVDLAELNKLQTEALGESETADDRRLAVLEQQKRVRQTILSIVQADVDALGDANGKALEGKDLYEAQLESLRKLKVERPDLAAEIDLAIAEIQQQQPGINVALNVLDDGTFAARVRELIEEGGAPTVAVDLLVDQGFTETEADNIIRQIPSEKVVEILADTTQMAKDLGLTDDEFIDVTLRALTDAARTEITKVTDKAWKTNVQIDPRTAEAERAIDEWLNKLRSKVVIIPVQVGGAKGTPGGTDFGDTFAPTSVVAGQPIPTQTIINITMPNAARPSDVVAAQEAWARRNGTVQVVT